ncbi:hypothetical protein [Limnobacter sp.]|uniref:hypothetical protein n=1 Tax=Limnobacter sp. TaxID=2003368 RepID=UPI002FE11CBD
MTIYYNPHTDDFLAEPLQFRLLNRRALKKYGFLINEARSSGNTIRILIDGTSSGLISERVFHFIPRWLRFLFVELEFRAWKYINCFGDEIERVKIPEVPVKDTLIAFSYKAATGNFELRKATLEKYQTVVFHLSHYFIATAEKSDNIKGLSNAYLAGDSDITDIDYFKHFFAWYDKPFLVLPFAVSERFWNKTPWTTRDKRAVATGSFHNLLLEKPKKKYIDFITTTKTTTYHPLRLSIYQKSEKLNNYIKCHINPYREYRRSKVNQLLSHFQISQKQYFSIDIVQLYNNHCYAIIGEELSGFPAIGAFEAMACGCVLIAQPQYYKGTNLIPGKHYLSCDGSLEDIVRILSNINHKKGEDIAKVASQLVKNQYNPKILYHHWTNTIRNI